MGAPCGKTVGPAWANTQGGPTVQGPDVPYISAHSELLNSVGLPTVASHGPQEDMFAG